MEVDDAVAVAVMLEVVGCPDVMEEVGCADMFIMLPSDRVRRSIERGRLTDGISFQLLISMSPDRKTSCISPSCNSQITHYRLVSISRSSTSAFPNTQRKTCLTSILRSVLKTSPSYLHNTSVIAKRFWLCGILSSYSVGAHC